MAAAVGSGYACQAFRKYFMHIYQPLKLAGECRIHVEKQLDCVPWSWRLLHQVPTSLPGCPAGLVSASAGENMPIET